LRDSSSIEVFLWKPLEVGVTRCLAFLRRVSKEVPCTLSVNSETKQAQEWPWIFYHCDFRDRKILEVRDRARFLKSALTLASCKSLITWMGSRLPPDLDLIETVTTALLAVYLFLKSRKRKEKLRHAFKQIVVALFGVMAATRILIWVGMPGVGAVLLAFLIGLAAARRWVEQKDLRISNRPQSRPEIGTDISPSTH
jgi:hypothetical protein